jgi:hypothetical protein
MVMTALSFTFQEICNFGISLIVDRMTELASSIDLLDGVTGVESILD